MKKENMEKLKKLKNAVFLVAAIHVLCIIFIIQNNLPNIFNLNFSAISREIVEVPGGYAIQKTYRNIYGKVKTSYCKKDCDGDEMCLVKPRIFRTIEEAKIHLFENGITEYSITKMTPMEEIDTIIDEWNRINKLLSPQVKLSQHYYKQSK